MQSAFALVAGRDSQAMQRCLDRFAELLGAHQPLARVRFDAERFRQVVETETAALVDGGGQPSELQNGLRAKVLARLATPREVARVRDRLLGFLDDASLAIEDRKAVALSTVMLVAVDLVPSEKVSVLPPLAVLFGVQYRELVDSFLSPMRELLDLADAARRGETRLAEVFDRVAKESETLGGLFKIAPWVYPKASSDYEEILAAGKRAVEGRKALPLFTGDEILALLASVGEAGAGNLRRAKDLTAEEAGAIRHRVAERLVEDLEEIMPAVTERVLRAADEAPLRARKRYLALLGALQLDAIGVGFAAFRNRHLQPWVRYPDEAESVTAALDAAFPAAIAAYAEYLDGRGEIPAAARVRRALPSVKGHPVEEAVHPPAG